MVQKIDWLKHAREILAAVSEMTLATADADGTPRAVTVGGEFKNGVLTWRSLPDRIHSKQVEVNPKIAFNFFDPVASRALYGVGDIEKTEPDEGRFLRYHARIKELRVVIDEMVGGKYVEPEQINPEKV